MGGQAEMHELYPLIPNDLCSTEIRLDHKNFSNVIVRHANKEELKFIKEELAAKQIHFALKSEVDAMCAIEKTYQNMPKYNAHLTSSKKK